MHKKKPIAFSSIKDFSGLFLSNIFQKLLGLIREPIIAYFFGSSLLYSNYLMLRSGADFFSQFTVGNALKANLLPKFSKLYNEQSKVSLKGVFTFSKKVMFWLFVASQIIQSAIILVLDPKEKLLFFLVSVVLSLSISFNFLNTVFLTIIQAMGRFMRYSLATTLNSTVVTSLLYPLVILTNLFGLVLSRLLGIVSLTISYVLPMTKQNEGVQANIDKSDFNFPILILGNFANIIIVATRFISGSDGSNNIAHYTYSVFILNTILTAIIGNLSTLLLRRISIKKSQKAMLFSLVISIVVGVLLIVFLYFFSFEMIKFIFQRGEFNLIDVDNTASYLFELSFSFMLMFIATTLFQPFFSLNKSVVVKERKYIAIWFISFALIGLCLLFLLSFDVKLKSLIYIYTMTVLSVILSFFSYRCYLKHVN